MCVCAYRSIDVVCVCIGIYRCSYTCFGTCVCVRTYTYANTHTRTHTHIHTHKHTHTHTYVSMHISRARVTQVRVMFRETLARVIRTSEPPLGSKHAREDARWRGGDDRPAPRVETEYGCAHVCKYHTNYEWQGIDDGINSPHER